MKNKHTFSVVIKCRCPKKECGELFQKRVTIEYTTDQRGNIIDSKVR